jgi:hypothetical protein
MELSLTGKGLQTPITAVEHRHLALPKDGHMFESSIRTFPAMRLAIFVVALLHFSVPSHAQQGPFAGLSGSWSGGGFIKLPSGQRERLRCRANYNVGENGTRLSQNLRCASDSYRFDVNSNIVSEGGTLSGSWTETSRNASGSVSGRVNGGQIQARIDGAGFSAQLTLATRGDRQSVTIASPGHDITEVSVALTRTR